MANLLIKIGEILAIIGFMLLMNSALLALIGVLCDG